MAKSAPITKFRDRVPLHTLAHWILISMVLITVGSPVYFLESIRVYKPKLWARDRKFTSCERGAGEKFISFKYTLIHNVAP